MLVISIQLAWFSITYINKLFFWGLFCPRGYCRTSGKVRCGECQVFVQHPKYRFCVNVEEWRKEPILVDCLLQIQLFGCLSINLPIHPWRFLFFFLILCVSVLRVSFCVLLFPRYFFFKFCLQGTPSASFFLCCWLHLVYDPPKSILAGTTGRISVVVFHVWVKSIVYMHISLRFNVSMDRFLGLCLGYWMSGFMCHFEWWFSVI